MAPALNKKNLMQLVVRVGGETSLEHFDDEGGAITKDEALVRLLWKKALGYTETSVDDDGKEVSVKHKPDKWACEMIAKARGVVAVDDSGGPRQKASSTVREMTKSSLNRLAKKGGTESGE